MTWHTRPTTLAAGLVLATSTLGGCSSSSGPSNAEVSAYVTDDPGPVLAPLPQLYGTSGHASASGSFTGTITGTAQVEAYSQSHGWVRLGAPSAIRLPIQSSDSTEVASMAFVPSGTYTSVRLVLVGCEADIAAGSVVGGVAIPSALTLSLGGSDGHAEVDLDVSSFVVSAGGHAADDEHA